MSTIKHTFRDEGDARRYFAQIPNIVYDIELNAYEQALYGQIKRAAGASEDGKCTKSIRTLAKACGMSVTKVQQARESLAKPRASLCNKPLILVKEFPNPKGGRPNIEMTATDIWLENTMRYSREQVPNIELEQLNQVPQNGAASSISVTSQVPNLEQKNNVLKKNKKETPSAHALLMEFHSNHLAGPIPDGAAQGSSLKFLLEHYTPDILRRCYDHQLTETWRAKVSWLTVRSGIGAWLFAQQSTNGESNGSKQKTIREQMGLA